MKIILLGPPGAGKGTQAHRLASLLGIPHIASGDIFRAMRDEDTPTAREVRAYMDRGEYVPDQLTIDLVLGRLDQPDARTGFLLDGFPRTSVQARALDAALEKQGKKLDAALYITANRSVLLDRLAGRLICPNCGEIYNRQTRPPHNDWICDVCGHRVERRTDEEPAVVAERLETYEKQTQPLVDYYREKGILAQIDGSQPIEVAESQVDQALGIASRS